MIIYQQNKFNPAYNISFTFHLKGELNFPVFLKSNGIIETVIKTIKIQAGTIRPAAFLNVSDTFSIDTNELSRRIKEKLPSYIIPSSFKVMKGFPKTVNGKIDREALKPDIKEPGEKEKMIKYIQKLSRAISDV